MSRRRTSSFFYEEKNFQSGSSASRAKAFRTKRSSRSISVCLPNLFLFGLQYRNNSNLNILLTKCHNPFAYIKDNMSLIFYSDTKFCDLQKHTRVAVQKVRSGLAWFKADTQVKRMRKGNEDGGTPSVSKATGCFTYCIKMFHDEEVQGTIFCVENSLLLIMKQRIRECCRITECKRLKTVHPRTKLIRYRREQGSKEWVSSYKNKFSVAKNGAIRDRYIKLWSEKKDKQKQSRCQKDTVLCTEN